MMVRALSLILLVALLFSACSSPSTPASPGAAGGVQATGGTGGTLLSGGPVQSGAPASVVTLPPAATAATGTAPPAVAQSAGTSTPVQAPATSSQAVYAPPPLQDAPANVRDAVILGGSVLTNTQKVLAGTVGNQLNCSNCHFNGGLTQGGKNGGISLVGVGAKYPMFTSRHGSTDLALRTYDWLQRSESGKVLPLDSKEFQAILAYYQWISKGIPVYAAIPWLGVKPVANYQAGDKARGQQVYQTTCSACHGADGSGTPAAPPVWGDGSYNDGAGMSRAETLAAFALLNMPRNNPTLTDQQAEDVAAFVDGQPRPHFSGQ